MLRKLWFNCNPIINFIYSLLELLEYRFFKLIHFFFSSSISIFQLPWILWFWFLRISVNTGNKYIIRNNFLECYSSIHRKWISSKCNFLNRHISLDFTNNFVLKLHSVCWNRFMCYVLLQSVLYIQLQFFHVLSRSLLHLFDTCWIQLYTRRDDNNSGISNRFHFISQSNLLCFIKLLNSWLFSVDSSSYSYIVNYIWRKLQYKFE